MGWRKYCSSGDRQVTSNSSLFKQAQLLVERNISSFPWNWINSEAYTLRLLVCRGSNLVDVISWHFHPKFPRWGKWFGNSFRKYVFRIVRISVLVLWLKAWTEKNNFINKDNWKHFFFLHVWRLDDKLWLDFGTTWKISSQSYYNLSWRGHGSRQNDMPNHPTVVAIL